MLGSNATPGQASALLHEVLHAKSAKIFLCSVQKFARKWAWLASNRTDPHNLNLIQPNVKP